jgi:hypothetical protein
MIFDRFFRIWVNLVQHKEICVMRWTAIPVFAAVLTGGAAIAYAAGFTLPAPPKIAFLYFADKTDGGWTQAFDEARPKIEKAPRYADSVR